jgi:MSHA biogenesis protein MshL
MILSRTTLVAIKAKKEFVILRLFFLFFFFISLTGCVEKNIKKSYNDNIKDFHDFFENSRNRDTFIKEKTVPYIDANKKKASIYAKNTRISIFLNLLSNVYETDINYSVGNAGQEESEPIVSLSMKEVSLEEIIETLIEEFDFNVKRISSGYIVGRRSIVSEVIDVNHHNFLRVGKSSIGVSNSKLNEKDSSNSFSSISSETEEKFWEDLESMVSQSLLLDSEKESNGNVGFYIHKKSRLLVVNGYPKQIKNIKRLINKVNAQSTQQVLLEIKILEVELKEEFQRGVQWNLKNGKLDYSSLNHAGSIGSDNDPRYYSLGSINGMIGSTLNGRISGGLESVINTLYSQGKVSVLSSQRLMVLNNERGVIKSGDERFFVTNVKNVRLNSQNQTEEESGVDLSPFFSGIALDTTVHIVNDSDILMHIHPMITRVMEEQKSITVNNKNTLLPVATVQSREMDTVIKASNEELVILGGLTQSDSRLSKSGLPINNERTYIGKILDLISSKEYQDKKVDLILIIKPTIINVK